MVNWMDKGLLAIPKSNYALRRSRPSRLSIIDPKPSLLLHDRILSGSAAAFVARLLYVLLKGVVSPRICTSVVELQKRHLTRSGLTDLEWRFTSTEQIVHFHT